MKIFLLILLQVFLTLQEIPTSSVLHEYVNRPDSSYKYTLHSTFNYTGGIAYVLNVTSHTWLSKKETSHPQQTNWVLIMRPNKVTHNTGFVYIGGSGHHMNAPSRVPTEYQLATTATESIMSLIYQVPNQPVSLNGEARTRVEDDLIAHTWRLYMETGRSDWIQQLPMVKGSVKCMESIKDFLLKQHNVRLSKFVVAGASKRGWTTWLVGASKPDLVEAIVPIVIPVLNMTETFKIIHNSYCFWPNSLRDYVREGIMDQLHTQMAKKLMSIVDPINYKSILTFPKFILSGTGDQFFAPDTTESFFHQLEGEKHMRNMPNADHGLNSEAFMTVIAFYHSIINQIPRPQFTFKNVFEASKGILRVQTVTKPSSVKLWFATNENARDFRVEIIGKVWKSLDLQDQGNGLYSAEVQNPEKGYTAYVIELSYPSRTLAPLTFSTSTFVVPNKFPCTNP